MPVTPAGGSHRLGDRIHRRCEDLAVDDAQRFDIEQLAEAPAGVVVRMGLRIVRAPVLAVEKRVGDPAVRLVHAHDVAACRKEAHGRRRTLGGRPRTAQHSTRRKWRGSCRIVAVGPGRRERHREGLRGARDLDVLPAEHPQELGLRLGAAVVGREDPGRGALAPRLLDRAFGLGVEVRQQLRAVVGRESERDEEPRLLVVVVVALRPLDARPGRILAIPGARILLRRELAHLGVGAAIAEGLVEAADAVVHRRQEHEVAGAPGVELAVGEDAGHSHLRHLGDVRPAEELPLVGQQRVDPGVVGAGAHRIVIEEGDRFVQVVEDLRVPAEVGVEDVAGERERHPHGVAIVVVRDVATPVGEARPGRIGVGEVPAIDVHHAVAAVDLDHRRDQRDQVVADLADVRALVDRQPVGELHERRGRAGLG